MENFLNENTLDVFAQIGFVFLVLMGGLIWVAADSSRKVEKKKAADDNTVFKQ